MRDAQRVTMLRKALVKAWKISGLGETDGYAFAAFPCCNWCGATATFGAPPMDHTRKCPLMALPRKMREKLYPPKPPQEFFHG